jgi:hypothetical protein
MQIVGHLGRLGGGMEGEGGSRKVVRNRVVEGRDTVLSR